MKTVLFIEDNREIRENMQEILEMAQYQVFVADNGKTGAALALEKVPDIILCDIMMPELDGYGVLHLLQHNDSTKNIPFIFLTALAERMELRKGMELGADDYITKPFSGTELLNAIEGRLKKHDMAQQRRAAAAPSVKEETSGSKNLRQTFNEKQEIHTFSKKKSVYSEGHKAFRFYQVVSGKVKIYRTNEEGKEFITLVCKAGDYFGYTALFEESRYEDNAEVLETAEIASITKEDLRMAVGSQPAMQEILHMLEGDVKDKERQLLGIAYNSLRKKVAEALVQLCDKYRLANVFTAPLLHISRDNLAAIAGTAKESMSRTLSDFRAEGLIDIRERDIIVLQEEKLRMLPN